MDFTPEFDAIYFAYFAPFSYEQHLDLVNSAQQSHLCTLETIGETTQGRPIDFLHIGNDDPQKKKLMGYSASASWRKYGRVVYGRSYRSYSG